MLAGDRAAIILVFVLPPSAFYSKNVSLDSLNGGATLLFPSALFASAEITFPKIMRLLLIFAPSANLSPVAPVDSALSEPAKSIRLISDVFSLTFFPDALSIMIYLKAMVVTVCALDEVAFMFVLPIVLFYVPCSI